jgi:hypothetical protein
MIISLMTGARAPFRETRAARSASRVCGSARNLDEFKQLEDAFGAMPWVRAGLALVHYDEDYEVIASITGQPARWAASRGSL